MTHGCVIARGAGKANGDAALNADGPYGNDPAQPVSRLRPAKRIYYLRSRRHRRRRYRSVRERRLVPYGHTEDGLCHNRRMLACDVHAKNHHFVGSFSRYAIAATVRTGNDEVIACGPD